MAKGSRSGAHGSKGTGGGVRLKSSTISSPGGTRSGNTRGFTPPGARSSGNSGSSVKPGIRNTVAGKAGSAGSKAGTSRAPR